MLILVGGSDSSKVLHIGVKLEPGIRARLTTFLKNNLGVFAWSHMLIWWG